MADDDVPEELDRVVSRRERHPTAAGPHDDAVYRAAGSGHPPDQADTTPGGTGGAAERAARTTDAEEDDEPTRSE